MFGGSPAPLLTITIEIRELKEISLRGGVLIDCIGGTSFDRSVIGKFLIDQLKMEPIAIVESDPFPPVSIIQNSKPSFPMQVFANMTSKVAVVISSFTPSGEVVKPLARSLLAWAHNKSIAFTISCSVVHPTAIQSDICAAWSTSNAEIRVEQSRIDRVESVELTGVPAVILNEGSWNNQDVIVLITQLQGCDDGGTSVANCILQGIDILLPEVKINFDASLGAINQRLALNVGGKTAVGT